MEEMEMDIFARASKEKLRFDTNKGSISVEDLWDLPLTSTVGGACLDTLAKCVNKIIKSTEEESFVKTAVNSNPKARLAMAIVKEVIAFRLAENEENNLKAINRGKKQEILAILKDKENEGLKGKTAKQLEKMLADL